MIGEDTEMGKFWQTKMEVNMFPKAIFSRCIVFLPILILTLFGSATAKAKVVSEAHIDISQHVWKTIQEETATSYSQVAKLTAEDASAGARFGSVAMSGDTIVVGAHKENTAGFEAGAVYIFERNQGGVDNWGQVKKLISSEASTGDHFGSFLAIEGDTLIVSSYLENANGENSGTVYVYERNAGGPNNWEEVKIIVPGDNSARDRFGWGVSLYGDMLLVGALQNDDACPGVISCNSGSAYIFERNEGGIENWGEVKKLTASDATAGDQFGVGVAVYEDVIVVGADHENSGGASSGAAYVFERNQGGANNWGEVKKLAASDAAANDHFGPWVDISENTVVIAAQDDDNNGGVDAGAAYIFERDHGGPNNWGEVKKLVASDAAANDRFSWRAVAIELDTIIVGTRLNNSNGADAGAAYIFDRNTGGLNNWGEVIKLTSSDADAGDEFGTRVAVSGNAFVVGAEFEAEFGVDAGAAYVFYRTEDLSLNATDDSGPNFTTDEATSFTTGNVLNNDISTNPISVIGFDSTNTAGLVANNSDGTFIYDPEGQFEYLSEGQQGFDTFNYTIGDTVGLTDTATVTITVLGLNDAPVIEPSGLILSPNPVNENGTALLTGSFDDPDANDAHSITVTWGDGSTDILQLDAGILNFELSHIYLDDNPTRTPSDLYTITATVDDGLATDNASKTLTVNDVAPVLSNLAVTLDASGLATLTGNITDPGTLDTFSLKVTWGDGTWTKYTLPAGTTSFSVTHQYPQLQLSSSNNYTLLLNLADDDSGKANGKINLEAQATNSIDSPTE